MSADPPTASAEAPWPDRPFAEVAVDVPTDRFGRRKGGSGFTYGIPDRLRTQVGPGHLVGVPLGPRHVRGIVVRLARTASVDRVRDIDDVLEPRPLLSIDLVQLATWMSLHYLAPRFACLQAMLPPGVYVRGRRRYRRTSAPIEPTALTGGQLAALGAFGRQRALDYAAVRQRSGMRDPGPALASLVACGLLEVETERRAVSGPPSERLVASATSDPARLGDALAAIREGRVSASSGGATRRRRSIRRHTAVLERLAAAGEPVAWSQVSQETGAGDRTLADLVEVGLVIETRRTVWRDPLRDRAVATRAALALTSDQQAAWDRIVTLLAERAGGWTARPALLDARVRPAATLTASGPVRDVEPPPACLLHGVTGSGKTELYMRAIEHVVASRRQAIVLVPEISLTAQTVQRFLERFPGRTAVWHSRLTAGERLDTWHRARDGLLDVIVGSRSAVFAPLPRLGLIVIDEEHAEAYKQESTPRYHAREAAMRRAALCGCAVLLGSATPSVETYYATEARLAHRVELPRRIATGGSAVHWGEMPRVRVIDMRVELRSGNRSIFSRALATALLETRARSEQSILFLNRRGTATSVSCRDCGHVVICPRCSLPLTAHGQARLLRCHHCNHAEMTPMLCPACGSDRIRTFGIGTERVEAEVRSLLGDARVLRWDFDTTRARDSHDAILRDFASGAADVLVGTQMIAKGLDLPLVTLVGVVSADTSLHLPDLWTRERTFQVLTQVAGRAGRSVLGGQVIFQTYRPDDPSIRFAATHDYAGFYRSEIGYRRAHGYPPFRRVVRLELLTSGGDRAAAERAARVVDRLRLRVERLGLAEVDVTGPAPAFFSRLRGMNRWQVVIHAEDPYELVDELELEPGWRMDVDPVSLL